MKIVKCDMFNICKKGDVICVTTNGILKKDGRLVMGAGIAKTFKNKFKDIDLKLGTYVKKYGNRVFRIGTSEKGLILMSFPTKYDWRNDSDLKLIEQSCIQLKEIVDKFEIKGNIYLPKPGCNNGKLDWESQVKQVIEKYLIEDKYIICGLEDRIEKYYAGIGSRETPEWALNAFTKIARRLSELGFTLRSGGANGADLAFEIGCNKVNGKKEIYLPWKGFNGSDSNFIVCSEKAFDIAKKYHTHWQYLKQGGQKLQARNSHQVLGLNLKSPCDFIICYTKDGKGGGGTGQALRIAKDYNIPIIDAGNFENETELFEAIKLLI